MREGNTNALKHGHRGSKKPSSTYISWRRMRQRCNNGYGFVVCIRWQNFLNFLEDMGERPKGRTLDRIDNKGDYEPDNCRWATSKEQGRNKRNNVLLTFRGETHCLSEWAEMLGIGYQVLYGRLRRGQNVEQAFV